MEKVEELGMAACWGWSTREPVGRGQWTWRW